MPDFMEGHDVVTVRIRTKWDQNAEVTFDGNGWSQGGRRLLDPSFNDALRTLLVEYDILKVEAEEDE